MDASIETTLLFDSFATKINNWCHKWSKFGNKILKILRMSRMSHDFSKDYEFDEKYQPNAKLYS